MCGRCQPFLFTIRNFFRVVIFRVVSLSTHFILVASIPPGGRTRPRARCAGRVGCLGRRGHECGHRGDSGGDGNPLSLGHGFGGAIRGRHAASGNVLGAAERKECRRRFLRRFEWSWGAATQLTFKLRVAGPRESITVSDESAGGGRNPSSISALVDDKAIADLPLKRATVHRSAAAGAGSNAGSARFDGRFERDLSYGGIRGYNNSFLVDGGDNNNGFYGQAMGRYRSPYQFSTNRCRSFACSRAAMGPSRDGLAARS